jgi:tetratricopeptide (TPR) repeat protein
MHDLLRAYAGELAERHDGDGEQSTALHRMFDHYLHNTRNACQLISHAMRVPLEPEPPRSGLTTADFPELEDAIAWLNAERPVLLAVVNRAAGTGFDRHAWHLAATLPAYLNLHGHWHDWVTLVTTGLEATRRLGDRLGEAYAHRALAHAVMQLGQDAAAEAHLGRALELFTQLGDVVGQARTHKGLAGSCERSGRGRAALEHARRSLELFTEVGHGADVADAHNAVGWCHAQLGEYAQTLAHCERALDLQRETGHRGNEAATLDSLGYAHHHLGNHRQAIDCYQEALRLVRDARYRYGEAEILTNLGETYRAVGDDAAATDAWTDALHILDDIGHPDAGKLRSELAELGGPVDG